MAMQRIVGGVEVEDDLRRDAAVRVKEQIDEQRLNGGTIMTDPVILRRLGPAQLQPVQGALAGQRGAIREMDPENGTRGLIRSWRRSVVVDGADDEEDET